MLSLDSDLFRADQCQLQLADRLSFEDPGGSFL